MPKKRWQFILALFFGWEGLSHDKLGLVSCELRLSRPSEASHARWAPTICSCS